MAWEISEDEERASFEVVRVADLSPIDRDDIRVEPTEDGRPCGCDWCQYDWPAIADASVVVLGEGIDPLDHRAVEMRAAELGLGPEERALLVTLFVPSIAIIVLRGSDQFTNGMHRTHALRVAGVERCVVYTGKGELPYDG